MRDKERKPGGGARPPRGAASTVSSPVSRERRCSSTSSPGPSLRTGFAGAPLIEPAAVQNGAREDDRAVGQSAFRPATFEPSRITTSRPIWQRSPTSQAWMTELTPAVTPEPTWVGKTPCAICTVPRAPRRNSSPMLDIMAVGANDRACAEPGRLAQGRAPEHRRPVPGMGRRRGEPGRDAIIGKSKGGLLVHVTVVLSFRRAPD